MAEKVFYDKHDKKDVDFEHPSEHLPEQCKKCMYFQVFGPNKCAIVSGKILSTDWCHEFRAGKKLELG
jgi:hypothetical protein